MNPFSSINDVSDPLERGFLSLDPKHFQESQKLFDLDEYCKKNEEKAIPKLILLLFLKETAHALKERAIQYLIRFEPGIPEKFRGLFHEFLFEIEFPFFPKRAILANLLGGYHVTAAVQTLIDCVQDKSENHFVRGAAIEFLGEIGVPNIASVFCTVLQDHTEPNRVRSACVISLGWLKNPSIIPVILNIIKALSNENHEVWVAAADALDNFDSTYLEITEVLLSLFLRLDSYHRYSTYLRDLLLNRDLIPFLPSLPVNAYHRVQDILIGQGSKNQLKLEFLHDKTHNLELKVFLNEIIVNTQTVLEIGHLGHQILL